MPDKPERSRKLDRESVAALALTYLAAVGAAVVLDFAVEALFGKRKRRAR